MNLEQEIQIMEMKEKYKLGRSTDELDKNMPSPEIDAINYVPQPDEASEETGNSEEQIIEEQPQAQEEESFGQNVEDYSIINNEDTISQREESQEPERVYDDKRKKVAIISTAAVILILAIMTMIYTNPGGLTGYAIATREVQQINELNQTFGQATETQLELSNIISLKISGILQGTSARVKLRINGTDYLVADIAKPESGQPRQITGEEALQYAIATDKSSYLPGELVTISINPDAENTSLYISYGEQTQKLENNTYTPEALGKYQAIALVTLPDNIIRLETNFTVINESINETTPAEEPEPTSQETIAYEFTALCAETCTIPPTTNPVLIVEPAQNSSLTITGITTTQTKENNAPVQVQVMPDMAIAEGETAILDLNQYFSDTDGDTIQYDINEISGIVSAITQNTLAITSSSPGIYTGYIYATDGDKLVTSNIFTITVNPTEATGMGQETNTTANETEPTAETPEPAITADPCTVADINQRPSYCFAGIEDQVYQDLSAPLENREGALLGRFNKFGNLIIKGLIVQGATGEPATDDFKIGITETVDYKETTTYTAWISRETGNLYLKGIVHEEQEALQPPQFDSYAIQNKFGIVLAYFDERTGDLYLKGNIVQLGKI